MSNMMIEVEFLVGTKFIDAVSEAKDLCSRMNLAYVKFKFNGLDCHISERCSPSLAHEKFLSELKRGSKYPMVIM